MAIPTYVKNVAKSFGYAVSDTIMDYNPILKNMISDSKSAADDLFSSISSFKTDIMDGNEKSLRDEIKDSARDIWQNFKDDVSSGELYRRDKKDPLGDIAMAAMGLDMSDFDFDMDDWGDDEWTADDSQKAEVDQSVKNTKATIIAMDVATDRIVKGVTKVQAQSTDYLANVTRSGNKAMYSLNQRGFNNVSKALLGINSSIVEFAKIGKPLSEHMQNSVTFFTKTTESLEAIKTSLANIEKNTAANLASDRTMSKGPKTFSDIFSEDEGISISSYIDMVKENFGDNKWMVDALVNGVKNIKNARKGGSLGKNVSVTTIAMQYITKALIPQAMAQAMKGLNESLKSFTGAAMVKLRDKDSGGNIIIDILKGMLFPENTVKNGLNPANYEKGKVAWDGYSRKALTEVIPGYLKMIYSALTGEERVYDYERGIFTTMKEVRAVQNKNKQNAVESAGGDLRKEAIKRYARSYGVSESVAAAEVDKYFEASIFGNSTQRSSYHNMKDKDLAKKMSSDEVQISDAVINVIRAAASSLDSKEFNKFMNRTESTRNSHNEKMRREELSGVSVLLNEVNGSTLKEGANRIPSFSSIITSVVNVIPNYLAMLLQNQQFQLGAAGLNGVYSYYDYKNGRWTREINGLDMSTYTSTPANVQARGREGETKGSSGKTTSGTSSDSDAADGGYLYSQDVYKTQEEIDKENKETQEKFNEEVKGSKFGQFIKKTNDTLKKFFGGSAKEAPGIVGSFSRIVNGLTHTMDTMFFGNGKDDPNSISNVFKKELHDVFDSIKKFYDDHLKEYFDKFKNWFDENFPGLSESIKGIKEGVKGKLKQWKVSAGNWVHNKIFGTNSAAYNKMIDEQQWAKAEAWADELVASGEFANKAQAMAYAKDVLFGGNGGEVDQYARGGYVRRSGIAVLSKGEMVIPSEYNPYYHGSTNKAAQIANEKRIARRYLSGNGSYIGNYAEGTGGGILGWLFGQAKEGATELGDFASSRSNGESKKVTDKIKELTSAAFKGKDGKDNAAAMAAGGIVGAGASLLTGAVVGPLFGAAIGAGVGLIANSEKVQTLLFGEDVIDPKTGKVEHKPGWLPPSIAKFAQEQLPGMGKGAAAGAVAGLFTGSPLLGAFMGAGIAFAKNSESVQKFLFGEVGEDGKRQGGLIPKEVQEKFKKGLPRAVLGAGIGLVAGPFGLLPNLITGAGIGFLTTSEKFHDAMVGKDGDEKSQQGSILNLFKTKIVDNLQEIFMNLGNAVKGFFTKALTDLGVMVKNLAQKLMERAKEGKGGLLGKIAGGVLNLGNGALRTAIGVPGAILDRYNKRRKGKNLARGYNVYDKSLKRNMTAAERNRERNRLKLTGRKAGDYEFDDFLQTLSTQEDLDALTAAINNGDESFNGFDLSKYSKGERKNLVSLVASEKAGLNSDGVRIQEEVKYHTTVVDKLEGIYNFLIFGERPSKVTAGEANGLAGMVGFSAPKQGDTKTEFNWLGRPIHYIYDGNDWIKDPGDKGSDKAEDETSKFMQAVTKIPVIGTGIAALGKTLSGPLDAIKKGLFGDGKDKKGILGKLHDKLFGTGDDGDGGLLGGLWTFFTGGKGISSIKDILAKVGPGLRTIALDAGLFAAAGLLLSDKLDDIWSKIPGVGDKNNSHTTTAQTKDGQTVTKDPETGEWKYEDGTVADIMDIETGTVSTRRSDVNSGSQRFWNNTIRGTVTGSGSVVGALIGRTSVGRAITNTGIGKLLTGSLDDVAIRAMSGNASEMIIDLVLKIAEGLKHVPILNKILSPNQIDDMMCDLGEKMLQKATPQALESVANTASTAILVLKVALVVADFTTGYEDARTTLGIVQEPTTGQRIISGLLRTVKNLIPFVGTLIPDKLIVDVFCKWIAPPLGLSPEKLMAEREQTEAIISQYNAANGTDYDTESFIKDVMHDYTWTERIGNDVRGTWEDAKLRTQQFSANVREQGLGGALKTHFTDIGSTFLTAFQENGGGIGGAISGLSAGLNKMLPGIIGEVASKNVDIWNLARQGKPAEMWAITLDSYKEGGENIEGTDLQTVGPSIFSRIVGQIPFIVSKVSATPLAILSWAGHKVGELLKPITDKIKNFGTALGTAVINLDAASRTGDFDQLNAVQDELAADTDNPLSSFSSSIAKVVKIFYIPNTLIYKAGNFLKEKIGNVITHIKSGAEIFGDLYKAAMAGDIDRLRSVEEQQKEDTENPLNGFNSVVAKIGVIGLTPMTMVSHVGHVIADKLKLVVGRLLNIKQQTVTVFGSLFDAVKAGDLDQLGQISENIQKDPDNVMSPYQEMLARVGRVILTPMTMVSHMGHVVADKVKSTISTVKLGIDSTVNIIGDQFAAAKSGDLEQFYGITEAIQQDTENPLSPFNTIVSKIGYFTLSPLAMTVHTGHVVADKVKSGAEAVKAGVASLKDIGGELYGFVKAGDIEGLYSLSDELGEDENNPLAKFNMVAAKVGAFGLAPITMVSHVGHLIGDKVTDAVADIKTDAGNVSKNLDSMSKLADEGKISDIWTTEYETVDSPLKGIFKLVNFVGKIVYTIKAAFSLIGDKIGQVIDTVKEKFGWVSDVAANVKQGASDAWNAGTTAISNGWNSARSYVSDQWNNVTSFFDDGSSVWANGSGLAGGASGFVSQLDPRFNNLAIGGQSAADNGCAPAVASMIANSYGQTYSMQNASKDANYYQNGGAGTTLDYFADSLGSRGINVSAINSGSGIYNSLNEGNPVVLLGQDSGNGSKANSPFGPNNHYVMASGLDRSGNIIVNDPEATGPRAYRPSMLRGVRAALATSGNRRSGSGSRLRSYLNKKTRNRFKQFYGGGGDDKATIYSYFKSKGMSDFGIAGLMGCWQHESGNVAHKIEGYYLKKFPGYDYVLASPENMDDFVVNVLFPAYASSGIAINKNAYKREDGHYYPGFGLAQWTGGRTYKLCQFAKSKGLNWGSLEAQLEYAWHELTTSYSGCLNKLNSATSIDAACQAAYTNYEGCGSNYTTQKFLKRLQSAYDIYNTYSGKVAAFSGFSADQTGPYTGSTSTSGTTSSAGTLGTIAATAMTLKDVAKNAASSGSPFDIIKNVFGAVLGRIFNKDKGTTSTSASIGSTQYGDASAGYATGYSNGVDVYNSFPYYNQNDNPWGPVQYTWDAIKAPESTIKTSGCGPTTAAMILKSYGVDTDPIKVASYSVAHGYRPYGGTSGGLFPAIGKEYGLTVNHTGDREQVKQYLTNNIPVAALFGKGDFTSGGHYLVLSGYDPVTNTFTVNDPNSRPRTQQRWPAEKLNQANNFWAMSKNGVGSLGTFTGPINSGAYEGSYGSYSSGVTANTTTATGTNMKNVTAYSTMSGKTVYWINGKYVDQNGLVYNGNDIITGSRRTVKLNPIQMYGRSYEQYSTKDGGTATYYNGKYYGTQGKTYTASDIITQSKRTNKLVQKSTTQSGTVVYRDPRINIWLDEAGNKYDDSKVGGYDRTFSASGSGLANKHAARNINIWRHNMAGKGSGMYNTRAGGALRRWNRNVGSGGESGLASNVRTATSPVSTANIDAIIRNASAQSNAGVLSPSVLYELLGAIAQILMSIAGNTGNAVTVTEMIANYLPKLEAATGISSEELKAGLEAQARLNAQLVAKANEGTYPKNPDFNDVDISIRSLKGSLESIATT